MGNGEKGKEREGTEGKEKERGGKGKEGRKEKGEREGSSSVSQPRASCCALYLRGNVPPSLLSFPKKKYNELEVATGTIRRAWARPSFCQNPINKRVRVAGELTFKVHGFGVEIQSVNGPIIEGVSAAPTAMCFS